MRDQEYYNRPELWGPGSLYANPVEHQRARAIVDALPPGTTSVLDVGCGDGTVTDLLAERFDTTGIDIAPVALAHVRAKTVVGSAEALPFGDASFDAVVLAEVLEHLDADAYARARAEAARVARGTIVITVPNNENLYASSVRCPRCGHRFSRTRHERAFVARDMRDLFPGYELEAVSLIGPSVERATTVEAALRRVLAREAPLPFPAVCPKCGDEGRGRTAAPQGPSFQPLRRFGLARLARRRQPRWILARYARLSAAEANRRMYAETAAMYDASEDCVVELRQQRRLDAALDAALGHAPGERVLDACGGSGNVSLRLLGRGLRPTTLDLSPEMLSIYERKARERGMAADIEVAEVGEFFARDPRLWDLIVFSSALHHLDDYEAVLCRAAERLTPGGLVLTIFDPVAVGRVGMAIRKADYAVHVLVRHRGRFAGALRAGGSGPRVGRIAERHALSGIDDRALAAAMRDAGLSVVGHERAYEARFRATRLLLRALRIAPAFSLLVQAPSTPR